MKLKQALVIIILVTGTVLRSYYVFNLPMPSDEKELVQIAENVSFNSSVPLKWLAKDFFLAKNNMLSAYGIKLGMALFGKNNFGIRFFPAFLVSLISLILLYFFVKQILGQDIAIISLFLLAFNKYHFAHSAIATQHVLRQLFAILALSFFFKILKNPSKRNFLFFGVISGIGHYTQPSFLLLPIILITYLILNKDLRYLFKRKDLYMSGLLAIAIILPDFYWSRLSGIWHYIFSNESYRGLDLSWTALNFFIIEIISYLRGFDWRLIVSWEIPLMRWYSGLVIMCGAIYSLKYFKRRCIGTLLLIFFVVVALFSFFKRGEPLWTNLALIPGIVLGSVMLNDLFRWKKIGKAAVISLIIIISLNSFIIKTNVSTPPYGNATFADYDLDLMRWYMRNGMISKAIEEGKTALMLCPNLVKAYNLLGNCLLANGETENALHTWTRALELEPYFMPSIANIKKLSIADKRTTFLEKGINNILHNDSTEAIENFTDYLSLNPNSSLGNLYTGISLYNNGSLTKARKRILKAIKIKPDFVQAHIAIGKIFIEEDKYEEALHHFNQAAAFNPDLSESHYWIAYAYQITGRVDEAERLYKKVLRMSPVFAKANIQLSKIYTKKGELRKALRTNQSVKSISPELSNSFFYTYTACPDLYRYLTLPRTIARGIYFGD